MKFSIPVIAAFIGLAVGQLDNLPQCARTCVIAATSGDSIGGCSSVDIACICSNKNFLSSIACCLAGKCDASDQTKATDFALSFCKIAGVTDLPTAVSCASGASSTTAASSTTSASATTTGTTVSTTTEASTGTSETAANAATVTSATASPSTTPNAGLQNVAGMGAGIVGAIAAVLL